MFAYGFLSVVLVLYLAQLGLGRGLIGLLLSLTLLGDAVISLWMTTNADRVGRRRILIAGAALMLLAAVWTFATPPNGVGSADIAAQAAAV
jgi:MFS family permease